jgi:pimeloyl-ACP methyl ester carboxylesterase
MLEIPISYNMPNDYAVAIGSSQVVLPDRTSLDLWSYTPITSNSSQLPLVIISSGFRSTTLLEPSAGDIPDFSNLATAYAMNGYRTVLLDHEDRASNSTNLMNKRAREINGVIDELTNPGQEVILVGDSLGAANALTMGMNHKSTYNPAISTIVAISPPTADQTDYNLSTNDWSHLDVPSLFITGTNDIFKLNYRTLKIQSIPYQDRLDGALLAVESNNFDIATTVINKADHLSFGNGGTTSDQDIVISMSLAMSDRYNPALASDDQIAADNFLHNANQLYSPTLATIDFYQSQQLQSQSPDNLSAKTEGKILDPVNLLNTDVNSSSIAQGLTSSDSLIINLSIDNQTFSQTSTLKLSNNPATAVEREISFNHPNTADAWVYGDVNLSFDRQNQIGSLGLVG